MKAILLIILFLASHLILVGQNNLPSTRKAFEGSWLFDAKASDPALAETHYGDLLKIDVTDSEFRIVHTYTIKTDKVVIAGVPMKKGDKQSSVAKLFTDGRGEITGSPLNAGSDIRSRTKWNKNTLEREFDASVKLGGSSQRTSITQLYEVSKDGKKLTITFRPPMELSDGMLLGILKAVYRKQD